MFSFHPFEMLIPFAAFGLSSRFRCLLDSRADDTEEDYLVTACTSAWHKHVFFELSHCVVKSGAHGKRMETLSAWESW